MITGVRPRDHGASPEGMQKEVSRFYAELAAY